MFKELVEASGHFIRQTFRLDWTGVGLEDGKHR